MRYLLGALTALLAVIPGCATNPVTSSREVVLMSEAREITLGRQYDIEIRKQYGVYDDPRLQAYVQSIGQKLATESHRPELVYHFTVLDSPEVNAFALPGGYIYITRGILAYINSEAELAAVLGHEIGHVTARHSVRQYTAATAANIGANIASILVPELQNTASQQLLGALGGALLSGYGREHELEADRLGAEYLARGDYDPEAMIRVIGILKNQEEFEKKQAEAEGRGPRIYHGVFASHPSADKRLQEVVAEAHGFKTSATTREAREEYLKQLDQVVFGDSVKDGIRHGHRFYHLELDLALEFPVGWRIDNRPQAIDAASRGRDALMQVVMRPQKEGLSPAGFMHREMNLGELSREEVLSGAGLPAYTAIARLSTPFGRRDARVVVAYHNNNAFIFFGTAKTEKAFAGADPLFLKTARGLRRLNARERQLAQGLRIHVVRTGPGDTVSSLARGSPVSNYPEAVLRLINNMFPDGEPRPGELFKIIR